MKHIIPTGISQRNLADLITEEHENVVLVVVRLPTKARVSHKQIIFVGINSKMASVGVWNSLK